MAGGEQNCILHDTALQLQHLNHAIAWSSHPATRAVAARELQCFRASPSFPWHSPGSDPVGLSKEVRASVRG